MDIESKEYSVLNDDIVIVTTDPYCYIFDVLVKEKCLIDIVYVNTKKREYKSVIKKIKKIGLLSSIVNYLFRSTYKVSSKNSIYDLKNLGYKIYKNNNYSKEPYLNKYRLGISITNNIIPKSFFSAFTNGMINVHHELLPERKGAQPVFWSIFDNSFLSGFSIHKINNKIDDGEVIIKEIVKLEYYEKGIIKFIKNNTKKIKIISAYKIIEYIKKNSDIAYINKKYVTNHNGKIFTSPKLREILKALINWKNVKR